MFEKKKKKKGGVFPTGNSEQHAIKQITYKELTS